MKFALTHSFAAPPEQVFAALTDPAVLQKCIDGCEQMVRTAEDAYDAHLKIGVAGLKGSYTGKVQITQKKPPESFTLAVEGKGTPGWVQGTARIQLLSRDAETELRCDADAAVGGLIAAVGSRLIEAAAKKMAAEFFRKLGEQLRVA